MSYVVSTCVAPFCHGKDYPCSVPVPVCGVAAFPALEDPFGEPESPLGSAATIGSATSEVVKRYVENQRNV